ncbi:MAG: DUF4258 domain-containing protein [Nitrospira sp.]|nr:DUF4258 domain-containing protein [Nitrospira sp.]
MQKPIRFDRHAKRRMEWRKISGEEVFSVINGPDKSEQSIKGRINLHKRIGQRYLKVTYKEFSDEILIISVVDKGGV